MFRKLRLLIPFLLAAAFNGLAQAPAPVISASSVSGCPSFPVSFTDGGTGATSWSWNFGGSFPNVSKSTSNTKTNVVFFNTPGTYTVTLSATNANGTTIATPVTITVYPVPIANFTQDKTTGCAPTTVHFTNTSTNGGSGTLTSFIWDFGDGTQDNVNSNPSHQFKTADTFRVALYVTNNFGCTGKAQIKTVDTAIILTGQVVPNFSSTLNSSCTLPVTANFTNSSTGPNTRSYSWDFGDGGGFSSTVTNPTHPYTTSGSYTVRLAVSSSLGCTDTLSLPVNISSNGNITDFSVPDTVCINTPVSFKNISSPLPNISVWNYGDGSPPDTALKGLHTYATPGIKTVTLSNTFSGCSGTISKNITVVGPPVTTFTGTNLTSCKAPLISTFADNTPGASSWIWNFGDGTSSNVKNPSPHTYTAFGTYIVTLTASSAVGCSTSASDTVKVQAPTVTVIGLPAYGCAPLTVNVSANANTVDGVKFYTWNFVGLGTSSNAQTPPPQIYGPGSSQVYLTVTTNGGCQISDTGVVKVGTVKPNPAFTFVPPSACVNSSVQFTDGSTGGANQWYWNFGDGGTDTVRNPKYSFQKPGTFNVKLIAYNNGCLDSVMHTIVINPPLANFTFSSGCGASNTFTFKDTSTGADTWFWDFDGTGTHTYTGKTPPPYTYPPGPPQVYHASLTVTNLASGCSNTSTQAINANLSSQIVFSQAQACSNTLIYITAIPVGVISLYTFDFGDGTSSTGNSAAVGHTYTKPGSYLVRLTTTDVNGCVDASATNTMIVNGINAGFTVPTQLSCDTATFQFTNTSSAQPATNGIKSYSWDFGDGVTSTLPSPVHKYTVQGIYQPVLTMTDNFGCSVVYDTAKLIVVSVMKPNFSTSDSNYCPTSSIQFNNTSTGGFNPTYDWNFGDGSPHSPQVSPNHVYPLVGQYTDTLTMTDYYGCMKKFWNTTKINIDTPSATFTMSGNYSACPPFNDHFTFTGHYPDKFSWNFGNTPPTFSTQQNPSFLYSDPGDYYVVLKVTSYGGCIATSAPQHVHIDGPIGAFSYAPLAGCDSLDVKFQVASSNVVKFTWIFGDTSAQFTTDTSVVTHHYAQPGQYQPLVILEDANGCKLPKTGTDLINVDHITKTSFTANKSIVCDTATVIFTDNSILDNGTQITNYSWNFNDGSPVVNGTTPTQTHFFGNVGVYNVTLNITTLGGCMGTYSLPVEVAASPKISINGLLSQCEPAVLTFSGVETTPDPNGPLSWAWNFGNTQTATGQNPASVSYPKAGEYVVYLKATNTKGCTTMTDTTTPNHLFIYPIPTVNAGPDATICDTSNIQLNATGNATSYNWLPPANGTLSCLPCSNPVASSPVSTYFVVNGMSLNGCQAKDTVQITVNKPFTLGISGPDSVCLGQSIPLTATGGAIYVWTPAEGLSDPNIGNPSATPDASQVGSGNSNVITYSVTGYDNKKCYSDTKSVDVTVFNYPVITLTPNAMINVGSSYPISSSVTTNIVSLNWTPSNTLSCSNCLTPLATPTITTRYTLTAVNDGGCSTTDSIRVQVICNGANFFVPNTFSPNGDGVNDYFIVNGVGLNVIPSITIYNRWGQIVFQKSNFAANSPADAWDGNFNGKPAPPDVYVYTIQILCNNATLIPYHGNVTLIR